MNENQKGFTAYEYANISVSREKQPLYNDCYRSFGWQPSDNRGASSLSLTQATLNLKRDRRINNRGEINNLQHRCEAALENIEHLEAQKTKSASIIAFVIGIIGTVFMALATFAFLWGMIPLMIVMAVPGFILWGVAYLAYLRVGKSKAAKNAPLIDEQYDIVYDTCEQAATLLA